MNREWIAQNDSIKCDQKENLLDHDKERLMCLDVFVRTLNFHTVTWNGSLSHSRGERGLRNIVENIQAQSQ